MIGSITLDIWRWKIKVAHKSPSFRPNAHVIDYRNFRLSD
ncbi:MAG: hypothetical protein ACI8P0_001496 [Planctomycetaceae bacterium]|jgi:hypothetical protein